MAVDVLAYNEIARINNALQCYVDQCVAPGVAAGRTAGRACGLCAATDFVNAAVVTSCNSGISSYFGQNPSIPPTLTSQCFQANYGNGGSTCDLWSRPWDCCTWASIPTLSGTFSCFCVFDGSFARAGSSCSWTVPSGVTTARFQLWGAGAGTAGACGGGCPGFSSPVSSGAYASVILPVTAGSVYTLCAGCAACCFGGVGAVLCGCASYVTGPNLCNFCADGGDANPLNFLRRSMHGGCAITDCVLSAKAFCCSTVPKGTIYGPCLCSGGWFCINATCASTGQNCYSTSCSIPYGCVTNATAACHVVVGAPGMYPYYCVNYFTCGIIYMPPAVGCNCSQVCGRYTCSTSAGSWCGEFGAPCTYPGGLVYGRPGAPSSAYAGNFCCGAPGAGGLVMVHYC